LLLLEGAINPITDICNELMRFHKGVFPKDVLVYFRDIAVHTKRIDRTIHGMREMLNEFQAHAGAGLAIQLSGGSRRRSVGESAAVLAPEEGRLAVIEILIPCTRQLS